MRASPYDLTAYKPVSHTQPVLFNPNPICIETIEGRKEYIKNQELLYQKSQLIRIQLINYYQLIINTLQENNQKI